MHTPGQMLDSIGRRNRKLEDKLCPHCGITFRPNSSKRVYCSRPCMWANNGGHNKKSESWWINNRGYVEGRIWINGRQVNVKKHRLIMELHINRPLLAEEDVHHINGIKTDNRIENLEIIMHADHTKHHNAYRTYKRGYKLNMTNEDRMTRSERMKIMRANQIKAQGN